MPKLLSGWCAFLVVLLSVVAAGAEDYPARPVRIIVGFPAGGTPDLFARLIAEWLSQRLGLKGRGS